jgi:hypothetical protein
MEHVGGVTEGDGDAGGDGHQGRIEPSVVGYLAGIMTEWPPAPRRMRHRARSGGPAGVAEVDG